MERKIPKMGEQRPQHRLRRKVFELSLGDIIVVGVAIIASITLWGSNKLYKGQEEVRRGAQQEPVVGLVMAAALTRPVTVLHGDEVPMTFVVTQAPSTSVAGQDYTGTVVTALARLNTATDRVEVVVRRLGMRTAEGYVLGSDRRPGLAAENMRTTVRGDKQTVPVADAEPQAVQLVVTGWGSR